MSTPTPQEMTLDALRSVPLFASLDDVAAAELRSLLRTRDITTGTALFRAGDDGDAMYLIESGRVRIAVTDEDKHEIVLAELARGDFFGEQPPCSLEYKDDAPILIQIGLRCERTRSRIAHEHRLPHPSQHICPGEIRPVARMTGQPRAVYPGIAKNHQEQEKSYPAMLG